MGADSEDEFREQRRRRRRRVSAARRERGGRRRRLLREGPTGTEGGKAAAGAAEGATAPGPGSPARPASRASPPPDGGGPQRQRREDVGPVLCQLCRADLSALDPLRRQQHVNRCLDELEGLPPPLPPPPPAVPDCPVCGKGFGSLKARAGHLKRCAAKMDVPPTLLLQAVRRQQQQQQEPSSSSSSSPSLGNRLPSLPSHLKRKVTSSIENLAKKPKTAPKIDGADEDLLVAMAMSRSLLEKEKAAAKLRAREKKNGAKPPDSPPPLLLQDAQKMHRDMEERVGQLLSEAGEFPSTPQLPSSRLLERERSREAGGQPASSRGPGSSLWEFSSLTGPCLPGSFTATGLDLPVPSQLPGTQSLALGTSLTLPGPVGLQEIDSTPPKASPFQSIDDGERQGCGPRDEQAANPLDVQALQDLEDLAEEGLTLTQWGLEVRQLERAGREEEMANTFQTSSVLPGENRLSLRSHHQTVLLDLLTSAFREMVNNPHLSDLQFQVDSGEILYAHMFVLYARCPLLMEAVDCMGFRVAEEGGMWTRRMLLSDVPREAVQVFLSYLYTADSVIPRRVLSDVGALADRFGVRELAALCGRDQLGSLVSGEEKEDGAGSEEGREEILEELLESMWPEGDKEAQLRGGHPEEAGSENMSEQDLEEIYQFAATQHRLAERQAEEGRGRREAQCGLKSSLGGEGGARLGPSREEEVGLRRSLCLELQEEAGEGRGLSRGAAEASKEEEEEEDCLLGREGCATRSPQRRRAQELSPDVGSEGATVGRPPGLRRVWKMLSGDGASQLHGEAFPAQDRGPPSSSPPPKAADARGLPGAPVHLPAASQPTVAGRCSSSQSRGRQEPLGREAPVSCLDHPPGGPGTLSTGADSRPVVVVLDSEEEEEEEEEAEQGKGREPCVGCVPLGHPGVRCQVLEPMSNGKECPGAGSCSPLHWVSPEKGSRGRGPGSLAGVTGGSLGTRPAGQGRSSDEEDASSEGGLTLVPDTPVPCGQGIRSPWAAWGGWKSRDEAGPLDRSPSPLRLPAKEVCSPRSALPSCWPASGNPGGSRHHRLNHPASRGAQKVEEAAVVILEDSEEEAAEARPAAALSLGEASSLSTEPTCAADGRDGLGMPLVASEARGGSPLLERSPFTCRTDSSEEEAPEWAGEDSDSSDVLPLAQRVPPAGTPPRAQGPVCEARERPGTATPQTPMPSYSTMVTPELKKELRRFGVRALPKRQMVLKLKEIFQFTHQQVGLDAKEEAASCSPQALSPRAPPRALPKQAAGSVQPSHLPQGGLLHLRDPSPGGQARPGRCRLQVGPDAQSFSAAGLRLGSAPENSRTSLAVSQGPTSSLARDSKRSSSFVCEAHSALGAVREAEEAEHLPASQASSGLETDKLEALQRYLHATPALGRQILLYQPIELAGLQAKLKEQGIRIALGKLLDFLDTQCITFTTAEARKEKRTPQKGRRRC
uniref:Structure-specific endonuclease subunit SLX4 n=1 Tax=Pogona vitticeps TaxID=103695 RepID=A0A6J0V3S5_9SAUR